MKPNEFAERLGVSVKTLQRWDNSGKLKAKRTM
ncbi:MerR family DNA-binding transcriptional regulator, partial [Dapis sp. BLCC M126]